MGALLPTVAVPLEASSSESPGSFLARLFEPTESLGASVAALLVLLVFLALPRRIRDRVRQPAVFLALHVAARGIAAAVPEGTSAHRLVSFVALVLLLASIGRSSVLLVFKAILGRREGRPTPKIVRDFAQGIVYVVVLFTALRAAGVEPGSLLTTSALLTAAVALALQETLGNIVAGLAIQVQHPFDQGDWIQFDADPKHIGRVLEINWRATKVITLDQVEVVVPNAILAKAPITNFTKPTAVSRRSLYIQVPASVPPHAVKEAILEGLPGSFGLLVEPPPTVVTNAFVDGNTEYWVRFFTDQFDKRDLVDGSARERVWYSLSRIAVPVASPGRTVILREVSSASEAHDDARRLEKRVRELDRIDFLKNLPDAARRRLAESGREKTYGAGEIIVREGDTSSELFIIESGEVEVVRGGAGDEIAVARLGPGEFFGEMALMTGEGRRATVRAVEASVLLGVRAEAIRPIMQSSPDLAEHVSRVIAAREASLAEIQLEEGQRPSVEERQSLLVGRIRRFFSLRERR